LRLPSSDWATHNLQVLWSRGQQKAFTGELVTKAEEADTEAVLDVWALDERLSPIEWTQAKSLARESWGLPANELTDDEIGYMLGKVRGKLSPIEAARLNPVFGRSWAQGCVPALCLVPLFGDGAGVWSTPVPKHLSSAEGLGVPCQHLVPDAFFRRGNLDCLVAKRVA
jgi:hypothetical protein